MINGRPDSKVHSEWVQSVTAVLTGLHAYVKKWHTTGLAWNPQGTVATDLPAAGAYAELVAAPAVVAPAAAVPAVKKPVGNLFGEIAGKDAVTAGLRKVDKSEMTHKNPDLRQTSVVPSTTPKAANNAATKSVVPAKPPKCELEGNKWVVEHQVNNQSLVISETEIRHVVYIYGCTNSTITISGKVNAITLGT